MPDHVHLLGQLEDGRALAAWASASKQRSAFIASARGISPLWQRSFFDRTLRDSDDELRIAAYILANPMRAGLGLEIGTYEWAGSDVYAIADVKAAIQTRPVWW